MGIGLKTGSSRLIFAILTFVLFISAVVPLSNQVPWQSYSSSDVLESTALPTMSDDTVSDEECTSIIVTGRAAKDGRAILMKNRDSSETYNRPVYYAATATTYGFVAVNSLWMGINERGLAVMNTAMLALAESPNAGEYNGLLNRMVLELCETVSQVETMLGDPESPIGPTARMSVLAVATCLGVVDRFGTGAFFEVSNSMYSAEYVTNGYQSRANHPRTFPGLASGPSGRDQYALDALEEIYVEKGSISWTDVAQGVSRYVHDQEQGTSNFPIYGEICNDNTVAAMVAVSGDLRYEGRLNAMWCEYGCVPMVGVFFPSIAFAGDTPPVLDEISSVTQIKQEYAESFLDDIYEPSKVREIQEYAFAAEDYTAAEYDFLMDNIPQELSDEELGKVLSRFIDLSVRVTADMYVNETSEVPAYASTHSTSTTTSTTQTHTTTPSSTANNTTSDTTQETGTNTPGPMMLGLGLTTGVVVLALIVAWKKREPQP